MAKICAWPNCFQWGASVRRQYSPGAPIYTVMDVASLREGRKITLYVKATTATPPSSHSLLAEHRQTERAGQSQVREHRQQ